MKTTAKSKKSAKEQDAAQPTQPRGYPAYRPTVSKILVCECGIKYIKTRPRQSTCIKCMVRAEDAKAGR